MTRKEAREQAFLLLFEGSFQPEDSLEAVLERAKEGRGQQWNGFSGRLAEAALDHRDEIDGLIELHSSNWKKTRISRVMLALLRVAVGEMLYIDETPDSIAINEAVELAKKYGGDQEYQFANGVLGGIAKSRPVPKPEPKSLKTENLPSETEDKP